MANYSFSAQERWAVWNVHGDACYMCRRPIDLQSMQVDHIVPEHLIGKPELVDVLKDLGRQENFNLNSYENWLPACADCNRRKSGMVLEATQIVQVNLQIAAKKADKCREVEQEAVGSRGVTRALTHIQRATDAGEIEFETIEPLLTVWVETHPDRIKAMLVEGEAADSPYVETPEIALTPLYKVLVRQDGYDIVEGRYGVGSVPTTDQPHSSFYCGHCGSLGPWNGVRCMSCGHLDDGD